MADHLSSPALMVAEEHTQQAEKKVAAKDLQVNSEGAMKDFQLAELNPALQSEYQRPPAVSQLPTDLREMAQLILFLPVKFFLLDLLPPEVAFARCLMEHHPHIFGWSPKTHYANDPPDRVEVSDIHFSECISSMANGRNIHRGTVAS